MATDNDTFKVQLIDSRVSYEVEPREGTLAGDLVISKEDALASLQATAGSGAVFEQVPALLDLNAWQQIARFTVCGKSGTARYLDLWDVDHFDGFTGMRRNLDECRAWFSGDGYQAWGSGETKSGRINCYFTAPSEGFYLCTARLQSHTGAARVECVIDDSSFGALTVDGMITQPHPCSLSAGGHHFRIRQLSGSFFFLALSVWRA